MKITKKIILLLIIILIISITFYFLKSSYIKKENYNETKVNNSNFQLTSKVKKITYEPLTNEEKEKITKVIFSSEMTKEIPEKNPISLQFFHFNYGYRTWQDKFIIANGRILNNGETIIKLSLKSNYIEEFKEDNLCEIIQKAKEIGDLGFDSEYSKTELLWKYKGMLKYKDCFGI
jgi:predicted nuclease of restriction endonuclease-like (RecB) superfamily